MMLINLIIGLIGGLIALMLAITVHEFAHAFISDRLGDPTARLGNRLSLNPLAHFDQVGTTLLLATVVLNSLGVPIMPFGWAKPVEYDPYNLRNPKRDTALIALAGPVTNFLIVGVFAILLKNFFMEIPLINLLILKIIIINLSLGIFNLIPIHPLDGSKIIMGVLPEDLGNEYQIIMHRWGIFILLALIMPWNGTSALTSLISPVFNFFLSILLR